MARLDSDGDVLLAGPAIRAVAANADVTLLCGTAGAQAAELLPGVSDTIVWDCPWIVAKPDPVRPDDVRGLTERIATGDFDLAVILTSAHQSCLPTALVLRMAGVPVIAGISTANRTNRISSSSSRTRTLDESDAAVLRALLGNETGDSENDTRKKKGRR